MSSALENGQQSVSQSTVEAFLSHSLHKQVCLFSDSAVLSFIMLLLHRLWKWQIQATRMRPKSERVNVSETVTSFVNRKLLYARKWAKPYVSSFK